MPALTNSRTGKPSADDPQTAPCATTHRRSCTGGGREPEGGGPEDPHPTDRVGEGRRVPRGIPELVSWVVRLLWGSRRRRALMFVEAMSKAFETHGTGRHDESLD